MKHFLLQLKQFIYAQLVIYFLVLLLLIPSSAFAIKYKHIVAFGDSLSDHYNLKTYIDDARESMTNGDVWIEYLSRELNATLDNNAFIGAMTRNHLMDDIQAQSDSGTIPQLGLIGQVDNYIAEKIEFNPDETLFSIWIGSNNLIKFSKAEFGDMTLLQMISAAMADIGEAIVKLCNIGATQFIVMNLPDFGKFPWFSKGSAVEVNAVSLLSQKYNETLMLTVASLLMNKPEIKLYCFDMVQIMNDILEKEIFPNVTDTYKVLDDTGYPTDNTNGPAENYLFWDGVNPTTKAHAYIANVVATGVVYDGFYTKQALDEAVLEERIKWDINKDNVLGLEEAIHALKTSAELSLNK